MWDAPKAVLPQLVFCGLVEIDRCFRAEGAKGRVVDEHADIASLGLVFRLMLMPKARASVLTLALEVLRKMTILGAGRIGKCAGKSIVQLFIEQTQIVDWTGVRQFLLDSYHTKATIDVAVNFYQKDLASEFANRPRSALGEMLGIDFHSQVRRVDLPPRQSYQMYVRTFSQPVAQRPADNRMLQDASGQECFYSLGRFLTDIGVDKGKLGLAPSVPRRAVRVMTLRGVVALQSRASGIIDAWSNYDFAKQAAIPHMASGGGVQYRVPQVAIGSNDYFEVIRA